MLAVGTSNKKSSLKQQIAATEIVNYTNKWKVTINDLKFVHVIFTNRKCEYVPIFINFLIVPYANEVKYP